jgi:hypothetical protein
MLSPCLRNKIALALLGDNGRAVKFDLSSFEEKTNAQQQTLALQIEGG